MKRLLPKPHSVNIKNSSLSSHFTRETTRALAKWLERIPEYDSRQFRYMMLFPWNPEYRAWESLAADGAATSEGKTVTHRWSRANRRAAVVDKRCNRRPAGPVEPISQVGNQTTNSEDLEKSINQETAPEHFRSAKILFRLFVEAGPANNDHEQGNGPGAFPECENHL